MAFLDNSGDIILDAVLTDTGRMRLSKGDGTFKVAKFAFGDDEINYQSYNKDHASGSAYYDLDILQTPILEAFTNNTSTMKSKLLSIPRTNLLYLPVLMLNERNVKVRRDNINAKGRFVVTVDERTGRLAKADDNAYTLELIKAWIQMRSTPNIDYQAILRKHNIWLKLITGLAHLSRPVDPMALTASACRAA